MSPRILSSPSQEGPQRELLDISSINTNLPTLLPSSSPDQLRCPAGIEQLRRGLLVVEQNAVKSAIHALTEVVHALPAGATRGHTGAGGGDANGQLVRAPREEPARLCYDSQPRPVRELGGERGVNDNGNGA